MSQAAVKPDATGGVKVSAAPAPTRVRRTAPAAQRPAITARHPAWITLAATVGLATIGIACISVTSGLEPGAMGMHASRQALFMLVGLVAAGMVALPHYRIVVRFVPILVAITLGMLVFVLLPFVPEFLVTPRNGARRWISLGFTDFQPSELAKIVYVLAVANYLRFRKNYRRLSGLLLPALITFVPMALILVEPDLGTAMLFLPALVAMLVAAGARIKHLALILVVLCVTAPAMYPLLQPHQKDRIHAMYYQVIGDDRFADSINYQGYRAMTVAGAGGVRGLNETRSRAIVHFNELPESHNDMIFAVIVNRFGLLGGLSVMGLYALWVGGALLVAAVCRDPFGRLVAVGLASFIAAQATINIGMTVGVLPITGLTLPFVSYGGSSLIVGFMMVGLLFNIAMRRPPSLSRKSFEFDNDEDEM